MKFFGAILFGLLALISTLFALSWPAMHPLLLLGSAPFWLLFLVSLVHALKPSK
jgi:hypothetical protein